MVHGTDTMATRLVLGGGLDHASALVVGGGETSEGLVALALCGGDITWSAGVSRRENCRARTAAACWLEPA